MTLALGPTTIYGGEYVDGPPVTGWITSPFGPRPPILTPVGWTTSVHTGMDISRAGIAGAAIIAPCRLRITATGAAINGYGNAVFGRADSGHSLLFAHLQDGLHASTGDVVERGEVLGQVGTTGASTGPHLHFGVLSPGLPEIVEVSHWIDPLLWLDPMPFFTPTPDVPVVEPPLMGALPEPGTFALCVTTRTVTVAELRDYLDADPTGTERGLFMLIEGAWTAYLFGAPAPVNAAFPDPVPAGTAVLVAA